MKKYTFLVTILLIISIGLTACGKSPEIICGNCAATAPGDSFFCPNCGTAFFQNANSTTSASTEPTAETTTHTTPAESNTQPESTHIHSFSAATCQQPPTCACGATNGSQGEHSYQDNVCIHCGTTDVASAYGDLCVWITVYGVKKDDLCRIDFSDGTNLYSLVYDMRLHCAYASLSYSEDSSFFFTCVWLDNGSYGTTMDECTLEGNLNPATFTKSSSVPVSSYTGSELLRDSIVRSTELNIHELLTWLDTFLKVNDAKISLADLGFTAY